MIENETDVRKWAREVVDANGSKFTPLSKAEQLLIAKYICDIADNADGAIKAESESPKDDGKSVAEPVSKETTRYTMTRGYAYHRAGYTPQQAFDEFLKWGNEHPQDKEVMDFSNGKKSASAAFSYWLNEIIELDVPNGAK